MNTGFKGQRTEDDIPGIIMDAGKRNPFIVPEGYFEELPDRILARIEHETVQPQRGRLMHIASRQWRAVAASAAVLLLAGFTYALVSEVIIPAIQKVRTPDQDKVSPIKTTIPEGSVAAETPEPGLTDVPESHANPEGSASPGNTTSVHLKASAGSVKNQVVQSQATVENRFNQTSAMQGSRVNTTGSASKSAASPSSPFAGRIADTIVCKGAFLVFQSGYHPALADIQWSFNGKALASGNTSAASVNTSALNTGTHQLSLVVSEKEGRNILRVANASITIVDPPNSRGTTKICSYDKAILKTGPSNPYWNYQWSNGASTPEITVAQSGIFWVTIRVPGTWCSITDTFEVKVMPKPSLNLGADKTICIGDKINLSVKNPADQFNVVWTPGNSQKNEYLFEGKQPGTYRIKAEMTGCTTVSDEIVIRVTDCRLSIPNVFTPNGDGINDILVIKGLEQYTGSRLIITDRNGKVVYENNDYHNDWDGGNQPNGTYFYLLLPGGSDSLSRQGSIMILR
jgi:gliding motility-associated-like protein